MDTSTSAPTVHRPSLRTPWVRWLTEMLERHPGGVRVGPDRGPHGDLWATRDRLRRHEHRLASAGIRVSLDRLGEETATRCTPPRWSSGPAVVSEHGLVVERADETVSFTVDGVNRVLPTEVVADMLSGDDPFTAPDDPEVPHLSAWAAAHRPDLLPAPAD